MSEAEYMADCEAEDWDVGDDESYAEEARCVREDAEAWREMLAAREESTDE